MLCPSCGRENPEGFAFCGHCGAALAPQAEAREVRKTVTVVFADVVGSTALGESRDPERVRAQMGRWFENARTTIERRRGTVEKVAGDAVVAVFGVNQIGVDAVEAVILARRGECEPAFELARRAVARASETDSYEHMRTYELASRALTQCGRTDEARRLLERMIAESEAKEATVYVDRARRLIAQL